MSLENNNNIQVIQVLDGLSLQIEGELDTAELIDFFYNRDTVRTDHATRVTAEELF